MTKPVQRFSEAQEECLAVLYDSLRQSRRADIRNVRFDSELYSTPPLDKDDFEAQWASLTFEMFDGKGWTSWLICAEDLGNLHYQLEPPSEVKS